MNSKMNGRILAETSFKRVWVQPSADDAGDSIGACFYYWHQILKKKRSFTMIHDYWGPAYTNKQIETVLREARAQYTYHNEINII